ncbi:EamA/RhaT family transporter [Limnohabitans sp. TS-CS-82]|uniref:DMT family transporter n=1 Tax=Limnohabitans sp. TS-CS-82 TaxID=2094193 RepID=UPI000CF205C8|nr:DMT family transporter [Limnohabitans sp. TS-CS-82]PQA84772.1 EamA/RhaT family transporter [Limnohabitans sp. TS-CS-82]
MPHQKKHTAWMGICLLLVAVLCFAALDTTSKRVTTEVPLLMAVWARYFFQALLTTGVVLPIKGLDVFKTKNQRQHITRGVLLVSVTGLAFASLQFMPVGEFTAIVMTVPLLVTLLATRMLGEHVSTQRVILVCAGFIGTLIIVRPGTQVFGWPLLIPLALVIVNAAFQLLTSKMARTEDAMTTQFYTTWVGTAMASVPLYWFWVPVTDTQVLLELVFMGVSGCIGHFLLILAFERSPAGTLMPYMYAQIAFAMLGDWLVFGHVPDHGSLLGIALIALSGIAGGLLTVYEIRQKTQG